MGQLLHHVDALDAWELIVRSHRCRRPPRRWSARSSSRYQNRLHRTADPTTARPPAMLAKPIELARPPTNRKETMGTRRPATTPDAHTAIAAGWSRRQAMNAGGGRGAPSRSGRGGTGSDTLRTATFDSSSRRASASSGERPGIRPPSRLPCRRRAASARRRGRAAPDASPRTGSDRRDQREDVDPRAV